MTQSRDSKEQKNRSVDLDAKRTPQPANAFLAKVVPDVHKKILSRYLENDLKVVAALSQSCSTLYSSYQFNLTQKRLKQLLQAVVDDRIEEVKKILDTNSRLLLEKPDAKMVIESRYTWQKFYAEDALSMAAKRKQLEMIETLLPYLDKFLESEEAEIIKAKVLSQCAYKEEKGEIYIPLSYSADIQILVDAFLKETFPNGTAMDAKLSTPTEEALTQFRNKLIPEDAMKLDNAINAELFLSALFKAYDNQFNFLNENQRDFFCVRAIGFAQGIVPPKVAEIWCEGLYWVILRKRPISELAASFSLNGVPFYHTSRESSSNLGYDYACGGIGQLSRGALAGGSAWVVVLGFWKSYLAQKQARFNKMQQGDQSKHAPAAR